MEKQKPNYYSETFKWEVVQDVLNGKYTKEEARRIHGIRSKCAVLYWMRKFSGNKRYRKPSEFEAKTKAMEKRELEKINQAKIAELEKELEKEKQRSEIWKKMVEIAEEEFGISIKKKYGAKQLSKLKKKAEEK